MSWLGSSGSLSRVLVVAQASSWHLHIREAGLASAAPSVVAVPGLAQHQHTPSPRVLVVTQDAFRHVHARGASLASAATPSVVAAPGLAQHHHTTSGSDDYTDDIAIPFWTCSVLLVVLFEMPSRLSMCSS